MDDTSCVETCRSSLFVISTIIVTDIYVHSLVELKIIKKCRVPLLRFLRLLEVISHFDSFLRNMLKNSHKENRNPLCVSSQVMNWWWTLWEKTFKELDDSAYDTKVKNDWGYTSASPYAIMMCSQTPLLLLFNGWLQKMLIFDWTPDMSHVQLSIWIWYCSQGSIFKMSPALILLP